VRLEHNILKMHLLKGVLWFMVSMPIIVLFFQSYDLTLTEVMLLQSIYSLSLALFEIPSGYIADVFGRKKSIVLGTILSFIGYLFFSFFDGFYTFAIAQALVGIAGSLISGSDSALIYDTLLETGNENTYTKIEGKNYAIGNFSEATAGIIGGFLAVSSIYLPVYIQTTILFLSIPIAVTLVEPKRNIKNKLNQSFKAILEVVQFAIVDNIKIRWLIIYSSAMGLATLSTAWLAQPFFKEVGVPLIYFGILWAGLNIATGLTSINAHQFDKKGNTRKVLILLSLAIITLFVTLGMNITIYGLIIIMFIYLLRGIATPMLRNAININTTSDRRATVLSIRSFIIRISFAICAPILGYLADNYSLSISFYLLAMIVGLFSILASYKLIKLY
jgi:MFS family permease